MKIIRYFIFILCLLSITNKTAAQELQSILSESVIRDLISKINPTASYDNTGEHILNLQVAANKYESFIISPQEMPYVEIPSEIKDLSIFKLIGSEHTGFLYVDSDSIWVSMKSSSGREFTIHKNDNLNSYQLFESVRPFDLLSCGTISKRSEGGSLRDDSIPLASDPSLFQGDFTPALTAERRKFKLALNIGTSLINTYGRKKALTMVAQILNEANLYLQQELHASLLVTQQIIPIADETIERSAELLEKNFGLAAYDVGHLFTALSLGKGVSGRSKFGMACKHNRTKGEAYTQFIQSANPTSRNIAQNARDVFLHELGHQFSMQHIFEYSKKNSDQESPATSFEPGEGVSLMSYSQDDGEHFLFRPKISPENRYEYKRFLDGSTCGRTEIPIPVPNNRLEFDRRIPYDTNFSIYIPRIDDKNTRRYEVTSSLALKTAPEFVGKIPPFEIRNHESAGYLRGDFVNLFDKFRCIKPFPKAPACKETAPSNGYTHNFRIDMSDADGKMASTLPFYLRVFGSRFGFNDLDTEDHTWIEGNKYKITWLVGGGKVAPKVNIYFIPLSKSRDNLLSYSDSHQAFPETFEGYIPLGIGLKNSGEAWIAAPKRKAIGFLLLLPTDGVSKTKFLFHSISLSNYKIVCANDGNSYSPDAGSCVGEECDCKDETPTPTITPSDTITPRTSPTSLPTTTISPIPSPTNTPDGSGGGGGGGNETPTPTSVPTSSPCLPLSDWKECKLIATTNLDPILFPTPTIPPGPHCPDGVPSYRSPNCEEAQVVCQEEFPGLSNVTYENLVWPSHIIKAECCYVYNELNQCTHAVSRFRCIQCDNPGGGDHY